MKPNRDSAAFASSLRATLESAASAPLPLPAREPAQVVGSIAPKTEEQAPKKDKTPRTTARVKLLADTQPITLRPPNDLLMDYTVEAGQRTIETGKNTTAQDIMLEVLQRGRPKVKK